MADEVVATDGVIPIRMQFNFTFAHNDMAIVEQMYDSIVMDCEARGLQFQWGIATEMDLEDVVPGSELAKLLAGRDRED